MYTFLLLGIESSLREKWRLLKSRLEEKNKGSSNGKPHVRLFQSPFLLRQSACGKSSHMNLLGFIVSASPLLWIVCVSARFKILGRVSKENLNVG